MQKEFSGHCLSRQIICPVAHAASTYAVFKRNAADQFSLNSAIPEEYFNHLTVLTFAAQSSYPHRYFQS